MDSCILGGRDGGGRRGGFPIRRAIAGAGSGAGGDGASVASSLDLGAEEMRLAGMRV
jgi:hypothetical protein